MWRFYNPVHLEFSDNYAKSISTIIEKNNNDIKNILLLCSARFQNSEEFRAMQEKVYFKNCTIFSDIENDPSFVSCQRALSFVETTNFDTILAIGGGSVLDTAKAVRMGIYKSCFDINKLIEKSSAKNSKTKPLFIAIPTTHGTSSELTMWATIWNKQDKKKYSLSEEENYPDYAIYDNNLFKSLPVTTSIITTLDALSHSFEALWNKNSNPLSDELAIKAIKLISENISCISENTDQKARENLIEATVYAGLAFSNTKTAAAHSISYPLTALFDIPHGIACSLPLYSLLKINEKAISKKVSYLLIELKFRTIKEMWDHISNKIKQHIPFSLKEYGVNMSDLNTLLDSAFTKGRMDNNIVDLEKNDVLSILKEIY